MLPVVAGVDETRRQILIYSLILVPVTAAPALLGIAGVPYLVLAGVLGILFVRFAWSVRTAGEVDGMRKAARRLFGYSILYLFAIFALILVEQVRGLAAASRCDGADLSTRSENDAAERAVRRRRSVVLALVLAALAILFFVTTIVRLGGNVAAAPLLRKRAGRA